MNQIIWYTPEYSDIPSCQVDISDCTQCIEIEDMLLNTNKMDTFVINVPKYLDGFRQKWLNLLHMMKRIQNSNQQFKLKEKNKELKIILLSCEYLSEKEWLIFRIDPNIKATIHFMTKSLVSINPSILAKAELRRIQCHNKQYLWHNTWWLESAKRVRKLIQKSFSREWREINKIIHEWILFNVDYESAIFYTLEEINHKPLKVRCSVMNEILSLLSILSNNRCRESTKSSIIATTRQHMFYIIECCLLIIHKAYHQ